MFENKIEKNKRIIQLCANKMFFGDDEAKNILIAYYTEVVKRIVEKEFNNTKLEKEDLIQIGILGVLNGIKNYKMEYYYFSTYIYGYIKNYITNAVSKENNQVTSTPIGLNIDLNNKSEDFFKNIENKELINNAIKRLPKRYQSILNLHYYEKYSIRYIAKLYNITPSRIQNILKISLENIKNELVYYKTFNNLNIRENEMSIYDFLIPYFYEYEPEEISAAIKLLTREKQILLKKIKITNNYDPFIFSILKKIKVILNQQRKNTMYKYSSNNTKSYIKIKK